MYDIRKPRPVEPAIDPDLPICDAHHHVWDWPGMAYTLDDYMADVAPGTGHRVETSVFVECRAFYDPIAPEPFRPVGEVAHVAALARAGGRDGFRPLQAIVGHVDMMSGSRVAPVLDQMAVAGDGRLRAIRHSAAWDASPQVGNSIVNPIEHMLGDARFRAAFACLASRDLAFEAWLYHSQLSDLDALAAAFPDTRIMLDHVGGPIGIGPYAADSRAVFRDWATAIRRLARHPNISVKLGGLGMARCGFGFETRAVPPGSEELAEVWRPYIETCIEAFGTGRAMFESNFPADRESCGYSAIWNAFQRITSGASDAERRALFRDNAHRYYRIATSG